MRTDAEHRLGVAPGSFSLGESRWNIPAYDFFYGCGAHRHPHRDAWNWPDESETGRAEKLELFLRGPQRLKRAVSYITSHQRQAKVLHRVIDEAVSIEDLVDWRTLERWRGEWAKRIIPSDRWHLTTALIAWGSRASLREMQGIVNMVGADERREEMAG